MDPLLALRSAIQADDEILFYKDEEPCPDLLSATHISIAGQKYPKSTPTRYRNSQGSGTQNVYSLEAIYLAWTSRNLVGAEYTQKARENGLSVGFVSVIHRKGVVDWLEGRETDGDKLEPIAGESTTPPGTPPSVPATLPSTPRGKASAEASTSSPSKRRYVADSHDVEVVKRIKQNEIELRDRNSVLQGNFSSIRSIFSDKLKKLREASKGGPASTSTSGPSPDPKMQARKAKHNYPIIMISSSPTALITMYNVKRFLQDSVFEPSQDARTRMAAEGNPRAEDLIPIYRKFTSIDSTGKETTTQARYFVVDSVEALTKFGTDAWDRVVCVMTTGQVWQFRPYKWSEPRVLFHHVKGIYVSWASDPPNPKIKDWNVTELKIDPHRRHVDKSVVAHFWKTLDTWTMANKPWLMKS